MLGAARPPRRRSARPSWSGASTRCATATPRATCTGSTSGLESMIVGEAEIQGQVKRAYELALVGPHHRPDDQQALPRRAGDRQARAHRDRDLRRAAPRVASVAVDAARDALGDLADRHVVIVGAGETAELTAQALHAQGVTHDVRGQPPPRARDRARPALRRRLGLVRRAARRARAGRHRDRLDRLAAHAARRGGDRPR